ncbi:hypothetical protein RHGRI_029420 [Rhododendron griersonianum]|uniref:Uncharacterized protein n=1 Tax=Rhododendron griersonianum TaxID=479676 RepID=A0AAV6IPT1_9ERIC|nr:hypothetical protein RHGRI_029420 [Rhododendron griersonianum]
MRSVLAYSSRCCSALPIQACCASQLDAQHFCMLYRSLMDIQEVCIFCCSVMDIQEIYSIGNSFKYFVRKTVSNTGDRFSRERGSSEVHPVDRFHNGLEVINQCSNPVVEITIPQPWVFKFTEITPSSLLVAPEGLRGILCSAVTVSSFAQKASLVCCLICPAAAVVCIPCYIAANVVQCATCLLFSTVDAFYCSAVVVSVTALGWKSSNWQQTTAAAVLLSNRLSAVKLLFVTATGACCCYSYWVLLYFVD